MRLNLEITILLCCCVCCILFLRTQPKIKGQDFPKVCVPGSEDFCYVL